MEWYIPRSHTRLTRPPPERPYQVTHKEKLCHSFDHHSTSRRDDTVKHWQSLFIPLMKFVLFVTEHMLSVISVRAAAVDRKRIGGHHPQPKAHRTEASEHLEVHLHEVEEYNQEHDLCSFERWRPTRHAPSGWTVLTCLVVMAQSDRRASKRSQSVILVADQWGGKLCTNLCPIFYYVLGSANIMSSCSCAFVGTHHSCT